MMKISYLWNLYLEIFSVDIISVDPKLSICPETLFFYLVSEAAMFMPILLYLTPVDVD